MIRKLALVACALLWARPALAADSIVSKSSESEACGPTSESVAAHQRLFGVTIELQRIDGGCNRRRDARFFCDHGLCAAGIQRMCQDPDNKAAMAAAGTPCDAETAKPISPATLP